MSISCANVHATIGEFQRNYIYKLYIEDVPAAVSTTFSNATTFQAKVDIYNSKAVWPDRKTAAITVKWSGEKFDIPGVDESTRATDFEFFDDESQMAYDFLSACKDLTGNEINQAGVKGISSKFNIGVAKVSVDKNTITGYRRLVGCRVYELSCTEVQKDGDTLSKITANIHWDRNEDVPSKRGQTA